MFKKVMALVLVMALTAAVAIGGTVAYLTDRDSEANVFTVGDVSIKLEENFNQGSTLIPGIDIEKKPTITNTGKNDAWVWATIAFPKALDNDDASQNVVHFNYSKESVAEGLWTWQDNGNWMINEEEINGVNYNVYTVLYQTALKPGETTTEPVMTKVYMDTNVDIAPNGDWYKVINGEATKLNWNSNTDGNPIVYVSAYATQVEGFADVKAAYDAYKAQWGDNGTDYGNPNYVVTAATATELKDALAGAVTAGETNIVVDAQNAEIGALNYALSTETVPAGTTVTIKNATVSGKSYGNAVDGTVVFTNCTFTTTGAYSIHFDDGSGDIVFNNCTLSGWCSFGSAINSVKMNNCTINGNGTYAMVRFYQDTELNSCTIDCSNANAEDVYTDGVSAVGGAKVTLTGCTVTNAAYEAAEGGKIVVDGVIKAQG